MDLAQVGRRLQRAREDAGLKQTDVAKALGTDSSVISKWETGSQEMGITTLARLCSIYSISCDYALGLAPHRSGLPVGKYLIRAGVVEMLERARSIKDFEDYLREDPGFIDWAHQVHPDSRIVTPAEWAKINERLVVVIQPHLPELRQWWKKVEREGRKSS